MKEHKNTRKAVLTVVLAVMLIFSCVTVWAEPVEDETYAIESFVPEETEDTETTEEVTQEDTSESEETETEETENTEETEPTEETKPEPTYREPLPEADEEDIIIPDAIGSIKEENEPALFWGFVAWICIGVGVAVVLAVLLTTKTKAYRGGGKKRYSTGDKISGQKRLLNDKYYQGRKRK